jgi:hypothetical protein
MEIRMEGPQKQKIGLPFDSALPLLGIYPEERNKLVKEIPVTQVYCGTIHNS